MTTKILYYENLEPYGISYDCFITVFSKNNIIDHLHTSKNILITSFNCGYVVMTGCSGCPYKCNTTNENPMITGD